MKRQQITVPVHEQLQFRLLTDQTLERGQGRLSANGTLCVTTGKFTGRSPEDRFIVREATSEHNIDWNKFNQPIEPGVFMRLKEKMFAYLNTRPELWARNMYACADRSFRLSVRIVTETPWANMFAANMFIEPPVADLEHFLPDWTILQAPGFLTDPATDGTRSANFTMISFADRMILIGGSAYTGEVKKGIFTVLNYLLPIKHDVLSMHCSANEGGDGTTALFFGLSGTGKTTLSADSSRKLIGDDEHGWSDNGIFNFEGGCYAKIINLSPEQEPEIYSALKEGALIENVLPQDDGQIDYTDCRITENTRASYPLQYIRNAKMPSMGDHPQNIFFLSCDAYGVLPPISWLNEQQAAFYFLNGYTAKVAGTEVGIVEPKVTFSTCFGAPFLPLQPELYARLLTEKMAKHKVKVWLVNTGWTAGKYGEGYRISIRHTRALVAAALNGDLSDAEFERHPIFGVWIPKSCPGVPDEILDPVRQWKDSMQYEKEALRLKCLFEENYAKVGQKLTVARSA